MSGLFPRGRMGARGEFRFIRHDASKIKGSGPDGEVTFEDIWAGGLAEGGYRLRAPALVTQDVRTRNKFTKRALSRMMHESLKGHTGTYTVPGITDATDNPFEAFCLFADSPNDDGKFGDARVEWDESDSTAVAALSSSISVPGEGRRGILVSNTSGIFKRVSTRYLSSNPYGELEYVFYAQPNSYSKAGAQITFEAQANCADGEYFILNDGLHTEGSGEGDVYFELDKTGDGVTAGRIPIDISTLTTADEVRDEAVKAVNGARPDLNIEASAAVTTGQMNLQNIVGGARGNTPYSKVDITNMSGGTTKTDFTGGTGTEAGSDSSLDNFMIKGVALTAGVACGAGDPEGDREVGIRAIVGLAPTIQGRCSVNYEHEWLKHDGTASSRLLKYNYPPTGDDSTTITVEGYVVATGASPTFLEDKAADVQIDSPMTPVNNTAIDADGGGVIGTARTMRFWNALSLLPTTYGFRSPDHLRKTIRISGSSSGNDGDYTIKRVIDRRTVEVYEAPNANETGAPPTFTGTIYEVYSADRAFDGRVENEGRVEESATDQDPPGTLIWGEKYVSDDTSGPHCFGRIFTTSRSLNAVKIIFPSGVNRDFTPNRFKIDILDPNANSGNPRPGNDADWITVVDNSAADQGTSIFNAGVYGYEYTFTAVDAKGCRISGCQAIDSSRKIEIAELLVYGPTPSVTLSNGKLMLKVYTASAFKEFTVPDLTGVTSTTDLRDALNQVLRGWQIEAFRSNFNFLWLRGTVAGKNSLLYLDSFNNGSTAAQALGFTASPTEAKTQTGITQVVRKNPADAMTLIYRVNITGDVPGGPA
jgi:hypothetical protein